MAVSYDHDYELNPPLGIDFGTTFSAIARWNGTTAEHYKCEGQGKEDTHQSVVWYDKEHRKYLTGRLAYRRSLVNPEYGVIGVKRMMDNKDAIIMLGDRSHNPMEISAKILAGTYGEVTRKWPNGDFQNRSVVVTVPYYFKAHQCANTRHAVELAGLECVGVLQEPIAASLEYALEFVRANPGEDLDEVILVFDLGGGTFDLTLFKLSIRQDSLKFEVLATAGDDRLGGLDFDAALAEYIIQEEGLSLDDLDERSGLLARQKIMAQCIEVKETLSQTDSEYFAVPNVGDRHIDRKVTREEFEQCIAPYVNRVEGHLEDVFIKARILMSDVTRVVKVGGSSKIPRFHEMLVDAVGESCIYGNIDDALCVAQGAAIYAAYLDDPEVFEREIEIVTVSSHALGIEIDGGDFFPLIHANTKTPCSREHLFEPTEVDQRVVHIDIFQGSDAIARNNAKIGTVEAHMSAEDGECRDVQVLFHQDSEQALTVTVTIGSSSTSERFATT